MNCNIVSELISLIIVVIIITVFIKTLFSLLQLSINDFIHALHRSSQYEAATSECGLPVVCFTISRLQVGVGGRWKFRKKGFILIE